jgi:hypothetical protein
MNRLLVIANRCLYGTVILAGAGIAAAVGGSRSDQPEKAVPIQLPAIALPPAPAHPAVTFPARNIFDPDGTQWLPPPPVSADAKPKAPESPPASAKGLILLPGVEGVLTDAGFVGAGQALPEGSLRRITDDGYVVSAQGGDREVKFDPGRNQAIRELFVPVSLSRAEAVKPIADPMTPQATAPVAPQAANPAAQPAPATALQQQRIVRPSPQLAKPKLNPPPLHPPGQQPMQAPGMPGGPPVLDQAPVPGQLPKSFMPPPPGQSP